MTSLWIFTALLWFGLLTMRAPERWVLSGFEIGLFGLACAMVIRRRLALRPHPISILLAVAASMGVLQVWLGISVDPGRTLQAALGWVVNCAAFSLAFALTADRAQRKWFLHAQVFFALGLGVAAVLWLLTASVLGPFVYKNQFAAYLESVLGIAIAAALRDKRRSLGWMLCAAALFAAAVSSGSRAGAILCLAELILLPGVAYARRWISGKSLLRAGALAAVTASALVAITGWQTTWKRLQEPNPYAERANFLRSSIAMIEERPLQGFGLGAWPSAYPAYARFDDGTFVNEAHNDWAQWAVEGGAPLLLIMAAIVALLVRPAFDSLWGLGVLAVFVHAWVDYPFEQRPALAAFLFAMAGVLAREVIHRRSLRTTSSREAHRRRESFPVGPAARPSENSLPAD